MGNTNEQEEAIFQAAREFTDPGRRQAYIAGACAHKPELHRRVEALFAAQPDEDEFFAEGVAAVVNSTAIIAPLTEKPGEMIGRYKLLQKIGEGGCGVVYMAEQEEPVRRRVALKIIKLGMDTKSVIARFEAERQALALMDHPNIAKVHDAGATETGRPYFVMELVRGVKITDYCDEKNLSTRERLELFTQVCHAIQHAHQKGIIHRDIKPSNILVTVNDGVAVPKVIDFGIAKATTDQRLTDKTVFTAFEQFIGTPAYMSPEQAEVTSVDIDTRSDIYSLGVLLYELLTGQTPFDARELLQAGLDEMRRTLREKEPERPSTRVSTLGGEELTTTAKRRGLDAPKLVNVLRGDLDWIVMKCLEKDRSRRYETANGLASDIQRHLSNEPVVACPPSSYYRFQKFVRRNKMAFSTACLLVFCLALALVGALWGVFKEQEARHAVEALRAKDAALVKKAATIERVNKARLLYGQGKHTEAEGMLDSIPPSTVEPDSAHAALRRSLGWWHAIRQEWSESASNLALLLQVDASDDRITIVSDQAWYCTTLAQQGDRAAYDAYRRRVVAACAEVRDLGTAMRICKACLLMPADEATLQEVGKLESRLREQTPLRTGFKEWKFLALALVHYRRGDFTEAAAECEKALDLRGSDDEAADLRASASEAILAMCCYQLHKEEEARTALGQARRTIQNAIVAMADGTTTNPKLFKLFDAVTSQVLICEAAGLVEGRRDEDWCHFTAGELSLGVYYAGAWFGGSDPDFIEAVKWYNKAADHGSTEARNSLAWLLATCPDPKIRNGSNAIYYAESLVAATDRKDARSLDTLAAAYAEAGQFEKAVAAQTEALSLNPDASTRELLKYRLRGYESAKPWRE